MPEDATMCVTCNYTIHRDRHNFGWSRDFAPALTCRPGETIHFECLDAGDGHFKPGSTAADVTTLDFSRVNPVTGPVFVEGAVPGDALKITFRKFIPSGLGWTANIPGFGLLADQFPDPALHMWTYDPTSLAPAVYGPKGRVPLKPFAGEIGFAPAEPGVHSVVPPRRVGGNLDIRDLAAGTTLYLPVEVEGALFSIGDTHAAQGDGEVCGTAIESQMDVELTLDLVKGANLAEPAVHDARPRDAPPRRRRLRGDDRHRPRPHDGGARKRDADDRPARGRPRPRADRRLHPALGVRRPAHQRDRRPAELARVVLLPAHRLFVNVSAQPSPILTVEDLCIDARTPEGLRPVLEDVELRAGARRDAVPRGRVGLGQVAHGALDHAAPVALAARRSGSITLAGRELTALPERAMRLLRGGDVAMIFQEPMTSLNPVMTIGAQLTEAIAPTAESAGALGIGSGRATEPRGHRAVESPEARARAMLDAVHITEPARRMAQYPHELSGGMRQRVMIAMALSCRPKVLIADEPTTALDVTVQAQILTLMRELKAEFGTAILLITHDMGVVAEMADRVAVLKTGRMVEQGSVLDIFERPRHDYTKTLLAAVPRLGSRAGRDGPPRVSEAAPPAVSPGPVLFVRDLAVTYGGAQAGSARRPRPRPPSGRELRTARRRDARPRGRERLGQVHDRQGGAGPRAVHGRGRDRRHGRRGSVASRHEAGAPQGPDDLPGPLCVARPAHVGRRRHRRAARHPRHRHRGRAPRPRQALLKRVHLSPDHATRYPHEFSGGQRQRICIARALALQPKIIVADESVSALDVSVRGHVLDLMLELQEEMGLAYLFISHDMAVVERMSHRVAVMRGGEIVEQGSRRAVFENPQHVYTQALLDAVPRPEPRRR